MRQFGYIQAFYSSFYSPALYRDVAKNWGAGVVLYLLLVLTICWGVSMVQIQGSVDRGFEQLASQYVPQIPPLKIEKGALKTPENKPYLILDEKNDLVAIIDTSGRYKNLEESESSILVTENEVITKDNNNRVRIDRIPADLTLDLEPQLVKKTFEEYIHYSWLLLFPLLVIGSFIYRLIQALFYALIGKVYSAFFNVELTYGENIKLAIVAVTPAIVFATVMDLLLLVFPFQMLIYLAIAVAYIIFAIKSNKNK